MKGASIVREARLRAGFTQQEMADRLGTTQSVVSRWEAGAVSPSLETLAKIVRACGLELQLRLAEADDHDSGLASLDAALTPEGRLDRMVAGMEFVDDLRAAVNG